MEKAHYYSLDKFFKEKFGGKVVKISIDAGFTCPNKDGKKNYGGCLFCNGSTLIGNKFEDAITQFYKTKETISKKWPYAKYIPFLEANTNTYADIDTLRKTYEPLLNLPDVVGLDIATRCDAFTEEIYDYLEELNKRTFLIIELGLQSSHDDTLKYLNRGHTKEEFTKCVQELKNRNIYTVVHLINGIPSETEDMMLDTVRYINSLNVDGIKFHMLYIEEGTTLVKIYEKEKFHIMTQEEYINILAKQIEILDPNIVIHRLVSGPNREKLIEPKWLEGRFTIFNAINRYLDDNNIYQGTKKMR